MGNSLQEQLLKAGLVSEQKARETRSAKRKQGRGPGKDQTADEEARRARQAAAEKAERDRELNRQRQEEARRKAEANELRQLIHAHRVPRKDGEIAYNFQDGASLKRIYVTADQRARLIEGRLVLVRQDTGYELLTPDIAERVQARDPGLILVWNRPAQDAAPTPDDEYAEYQIPDDLMW